MIPLLTTGIGLLMAVLIIFLVRRDHLHVNRGFGWFLTAFGFALLGLSPSLVDSVAGRLGVSYPPTLALIIAISALIIKILLMDIDRSKLDVRSQRLTQRLAILEAELDKLRRADQPKQQPPESSDH